MGAVTKNFKLQAPVILGLIKDGPVTSSYPYTPTNYGYSNKADPETVLLSYSFPKLDAPPDW